MNQAAPDPTPTKPDSNERERPMRKHITRRQALNCGGMALAVTGATATLGFPLLAKADDAELLARVAEFWKAHEKNASAHDAYMTRQNEIEAMPDYPPEPDPQLAHEDYDAFIKRRNEQSDFQDRHGRGEMYDAWAKTGKRMGHISMSGPEGAMVAFQDLGVWRKVFIHINNSNPVLLEDSPERAAVTAAGWDVAFDGMEISL